MPHYTCCPESNEKDKLSTSENYIHSMISQLPMAVVQKNRDINDVHWGANSTYYVSNISWECNFDKNEGIRSEYENIVKDSWAIYSLGSNIQNDKQSYIPDYEFYCSIKLRVSDKLHSQRNRYFDFFVSLFIFLLVFWRWINFCFVFVLYCFQLSLSFLFISFN